MKRSTKTYLNRKYLSTMIRATASFSERDKLEGPLKFDECKKVLETFQNNKFSGEDGFTAEFYKLFFDLLGNNLIASLNEAHALNERGNYFDTQRRWLST